MELHATAIQQALIRRAIEAGRYKSEEDAARAALELWEERELERTALLAALDEGETDLVAGRFKQHDNGSTLAREIKLEARAQRQQS